MALARRRYLRPEGDALRAYAEHRQLGRMSKGYPVERNSFLRDASPLLMAERGLIKRVEHPGTRYQAWYVITELGQDYLRNVPQPPNPRANRPSINTRALL